jgi:hypothetical protein
VGQYDLSFMDKIELNSEPTLGCSVITLALPTIDTLFVINKDDSDGGITKCNL